MKNWLILMLILALSLSACEFETPTPVLSNVEGPTEEPAEDVVAMQTEALTEEPIQTEEPVETEVPTEAPTELPPTEDPALSDNGPANYRR